MNVVVNVNNAADSTSVEEPGELVTMCHKPGTPAEHTIEVPQAAVQAHLDHGDTLGACPVSVVEDPGPEPEPEPVTE